MVELDVFKSLFLSCLNRTKQVLTFFSSSNGVVLETYMVSSGSIQATRDNLSFLSKFDPWKLLKISKFWGFSSCLSIFSILFWDFSTKFVLASIKVDKKYQKSEF